jgi:hypothetical protein
MLQPVGKAQGKRITRAPFDEHAAVAIYHVLGRQFAHWQARLLHNLHNEWAHRGVAKGLCTLHKLEKADDDRQLSFPWIDAAIDDAIDEPSAASMRETAEAMAAAYVGSADHTIRQTGLEDPNPLLLRINTEAVDYANSRGAEMVGRRYDTDGNLIDNPDADWAITDTARNVLRREIRDSLATDRDVDRLADHIADTGIFSDDRAEMIARTEISMAQNAGTLEAGRQAAAAGLNVRKIWTLGPNPCPQCEDAAAEGDIDLEDDFGGEAGDAPPLHPNCECSLDLFVADDQEEEEPEEEESEMKHASARRFERIFRNDAADDEDETDNGDNDEHLISTLADLMVEAGSADGEVTREDALRYLLHSGRGQAPVARMAAHRKSATSKGKAFTMNRSEQLRAVVKRAGGVHGLAKRIVRDGTSGDITEHELTQLAVDAAKRQYGISDDAKAFTKMFCDAGPDGQTLQRAIQIAKVTQVSGDDGDDDDEATAMEELHRLAEQHQRSNPELTPQQSFARIFADPRNAALAHRAHKRPVANAKMLYPFPR